MSQSQSHSDSNVTEVRKSKRKRVPIKHLGYNEGSKEDDDERSKKPTKVKKDPDPEADCELKKVNLLVKKTYERVRRSHGAKRAADNRSQWAYNVQTLEEDHKEHVKLRAKSINNSQTISTQDLVKAFQSVTSGAENASEKAFTKLIPEEVYDHKSSTFIEKETVTRSSIITLQPLIRIPPVLSWTSIPYNVHEDDGKFLTNIPFLGDEVIDKDKKFIDDMVTLYEGKIHGIGDSKRFRMEEDVFFDLVEALKEIESKKGTGVFKDGDNLSINDKPSSEGPVGTCGEKEESKVITDGAISSSSILGVNVDLGCKSPSKDVLAAISSTFKGIGTVEELKCRYETLLRKRLLQPKDKPKLPLLPSGVEQQDPSTYSIPNIEGPYAKDLPKESAMHAYQFLFCRRCFQYDCTRGHNGDDQVDLKYYRQKRTPGSSLNFQCDNLNCWQIKDAEGDGEGGIDKPKDDILSEWTPGDKSMFRCLTDSFPNYCYVAKLMMNKSCRQVYEYANLQNDPTGDLDTTLGGGGGKKSSQKSSNVNSSSTSSIISKRRPKPWNKKASSVNKKNLARRWINNVKRSEKSSGGIKTGGVLPPKFMPCQHDSGIECDEKNPQCYCGHNGTSCEKFCTCPATCKRRFPGCRCTSTCDSKRCVCFFAARECDPDLCTACGSNQHSVENITCRNVNIQRRLHKHLLMGKSDVAGWGIFIKEEAQKGEFIAEYRGEIISHDESERRGHVYDKIQHTFLFELNDHFVVDATRKGNKARFVNSSKNPNCEVKRMLVNGDHRIGIYAKRCIEAGEELFYDYEDVLVKQMKVAAASAAATAVPSTSVQSQLKNI